MDCSRLLCPRDFPGKNTGAGCHFLLRGNLPNPGTEPESPASPALAGGFWATWEAHNFLVYVDLSAWCLALFLREKRPECNNPLGIALYHPPSNNLIYKYGLVLSPRACFRLWLRQAQFRNWKMASTIQLAPHGDASTAAGNLHLVPSPRFSFLCSPWYFIEDRTGIYIQRNSLPPFAAHKLIHLLLIYFWF